MLIFNVTKDPNIQFSISITAVLYLALGCWSRSGVQYFSRTSLHWTRSEQCYTSGSDSCTWQTHSRACAVDSITLLLSLVVIGLPKWVIRQNSGRIKQHFVTIQSFLKITKRTQIRKHSVFLRWIRKLTMSFSWIMHLKWLFSGWWATVMELLSGNVDFDHVWIFPPCNCIY